MAFLERRVFTFFDIHKNVDNGKVAECLQDTHVTATTSGNGHVVLCDVTGWAHLISRSWEITSFKAYELTVTLAQQLPHDPYLVTIGDDETGVLPLIKVWDWSRRDRHGNPTCTRVSRAVPSHMKPTPATALAVHENKNLLAVGFLDGSVSLFRGDIARQRSGKMRTLPDTGTSPITALAFKGADKLYVVSRAAVSVVWLGVERCVALDCMGAAPACAVLADSQGLTIANNEALYVYTTEGRGPCYALEGEKVRLDWFRSYLVITRNESPSKSTASTSTAPIPKSHNITILDIQNKFIVFSKAFEEIDAVLTEWGSFYILTKNKEMIYLEEKDLQSKLTLLFKKNLYDVAIRIASSQHYDEAGLTEIYKQYGDHLYSKGDLKGAIEQYVKTIGWLETSYVIRKYLESRHLEPLVQYLEELHKKKGCATEDHTTLLLTCYMKIDQHDHQGKLKEFINSKDKAIDFDVDVAIKVMRQVSVDDALSLAANYKRHDWYLKMMLEDKKDYRQALDYIVELEFEDADMYMKKYGHRLIQHEPEESTNFLKLLCTDYKPRSKPLVDEASLSGGGVRAPAFALPDEYIHMFLANSERLIDFLEHMIKTQDDCSKLVYDALIEHYIHVWAKSPESEKKEYEEKILGVLKNPEANYDKDQTLIICQMLGFQAGVLYLYEENKLWRAQVGLHLRGADAAGALAVCRRRGALCPRLWLDVLGASPPASALPELLNVIANEKLLSPILVVDCLASTPTYTLGDVRKYLTDVLKSEADVISRSQELSAKYRAESARMKEQARALQERPVVLQASRCAVCNKPLELPTMHFLCQHSFHQSCFTTYAESESECLVCAAGRRRPDAAPHAAEALHARIHNELDPYAVVSEYYGRGLFNKVTVVTENETVEPPAPAGPAQPTPLAPTPAPAAQPYGPGAEAKLRLQEGQSKQIFVSNATKQVAPKGTTVVPMPEGRMRVIEQQRYSSSLEANLNKLEPVHKPSPYSSPITAKKRIEENQRSLGVSPVVQNNISSAISNGAGKNPFEEDTYDETKNPFAEEATEPTNPFSEDDDYDSNYNPFS
ncbi:vacuolar protein sorting-associated protein 11 homolog [Spodoptera litura]|uniref:Vacuolar protein sorting-associated protein 11 homolog n=1 Tax=Spodoptera litura TaxID=69820 RepID=A0A9J7E652_SPOLT|nr:vacuolar protein sorting-associated protein 11 homolog [Spodoptera litura]